jgi:hypothetical protein
LPYTRAVRTISALTEPPLYLARLQPLPHVERHRHQNRTLSFVIIGLIDLGLIDQ